MQNFNLSTVKSIIFDLGGVLLNLDNNLSVEAFARLAHVSKDKIYNAMRSNDFFDDFERGDLNEAEFRNKIRYMLSDDITDVQIDSAWNCMLLDLPIDRILALDKLRDKYKTVVLSNTNAIHFTYFQKKVQHSFDGKTFEQYFDQVYYSHLLNMRKPDPDIFEFVLEDLDIKASEALFIDDTLSNISTANKLGFQTWHLQDQNQLVPVLMKDE